MKNNNIFIIAWDFPPVFTGESIVCYKTIKYSRYNYDVCYNSSSLGDKKYEYVSNVNAIPLKGSYLKWSFAILKTFLQLDKSNNYKVFESRVMPSIGHFTGFLVKLFKPSIKWVVYFSDPVWNSPYCNLIDQIKGKMKKHPLFRIMLFSSIFSWIAIRMSDKVVFNNAYLAKHVLGKAYKKYEKKICIVPYGFDEESLRNIMPIYERKDKLVISHIGQIYGARNFDTLIEALKKMKINYPEQYSKVVIRQIGYLCTEEKEKIMSSGVEDVFEIIEAVDFECSLTYMKSSDYLLTIDALFKQLNYNLYIPSKIFDYIGVKKPIVAISQSVGPSADIIRNTGNVLIEHDSEAMLKFLLQAVSGNVKEPYYYKYDSYDCKTGVDIFDAIFNELLNNYRK